MLLISARSEANSGAGPRGKDRMERSPQCACWGLVRGTGEQLGRGGVDILDQCDGVAPGGVAAEGHLVLLGEINADRGAAEREEIVLIAELCIEEVRRELLAERIKVARIAHPA